MITASLTASLTASNYKLIQDKPQFLAQQITGVIHSLSSMMTGIRIKTVIGGSSIDEDANEMHFHEVDRKWIIQAMEEYAALSQLPVSGSYIRIEIVDYFGTKKVIEVKPYFDKQLLPPVFYHGTDASGIEGIISKQKISVKYFDGDGFYLTKNIEDANNHGQYVLVFQNIDNNKLETDDVNDGFLYRGSLAISEILEIIILKNDRRFLIDLFSSLVEG